MATSTLGSGTLVLAGTTSGTTTVTATAVAGTTTLTLPAATDTLVGKATTDTLTNKTLTGAAMNGTLGATTPSTASVTTLTTSSTITHNGGTANGVAYLNGSKVLTTNSALVFDGSNLGVGGTPSAWDSTFRAQEFGTSGSQGAIALQNNGSIYVGFNFYYDGTNYKYVKSSYSTVYQSGTNGQHAWYTAASGTAGNAITFTQAMTLDASGNLLVGGTTQLGKLTVETTTAGTYTGYNRNTNATPGAAVIDLAIFSAASPNNTTAGFYFASDNVGAKAIIYSNGGLHNYSANNVNLSDRREKTNFVPAGDYLAKICAIPVQTFNYIDQNMEDDGGLTLGVVAQDVQAVAPELVMESNWAGKDEEPKMRLSIYQTDLQYALMKCIQEQQSLITQLTARITALEGA